MPAQSLADLVSRDEVGSVVYWRKVDAATPADVADVVRLCTAPEPRIRAAALTTLPLAVDGPTARWVDVVAAATRDEDAQVREVACFVLAEQWRDVDTPDARRALADRRYDREPLVRALALLGLARRGDRTVVDGVRRALDAPTSPATRPVLAAAAALGDADLHPLVLAHRSATASIEWRRTADAARRLTDPSGPGDDLLDGLAGLYRRRAHGRPDGDALGWWHRTHALLEVAPDRARGLFEAIAARLADDPAALRELRENSTLAVEAGIR